LVSDDCAVARGDSLVFFHEDFMEATRLWSPSPRMLWLELTRSCNEQCGHCYNDSGPHRAGEQTLGLEAWLRILEEGRSLGVSEVQFIGGEPTLVPYLEELLVAANRLGYGFIEVYTNGTRVSDSLLKTIVENGISVAVSLYSHDADVHDRMTSLPGSHARTVETIRRLHEANVPLRVAVVRVPLNAPTCEATVKFVRDMGIEAVGIDDARAFGRAQHLTGRPPQLKELCGHCWEGTACVDPQGNVSPCIMSRHMVVGNAGSSALDEIFGSQELDSAREQIYTQVYVPRQETANCGPNNPNPTPNCGPYSTPGNPCSPLQCMPQNGTPCYPIGKRTPTDVCLPGAEEGGIAELLGATEQARSAVSDLVAIEHGSGCNPNNPNPVPNCIPYSTKDNPCAPHQCMPQNGGRCYPIGG